MAMDDIRRVRVTVGGTQYTLRGQQSEERLFSIARMVDQKMKAVSEANPNLDTKRIAVLAALNIAEEFYKLRDQYDSLMALLDEQTKSQS